MIVITPRGIWGGGRKQVVLDLRSDNIGIAGVREEGLEYPARFYFERAYRKKGEGISEELEKLERKIDEGEIIAILGRPGKFVSVNAKEILQNQENTKTERLENKISEVVEKEGQRLVGASGGKIRENIRTIFRVEDGVVEVYFVLKKKSLESEEFRKLLGFLSKAAQLSGKWLTELVGGKEDSDNSLSWTKEARYKTSLFLGEDNSYHKGLIRYRLGDLEEKLQEFNPGVYLALSLYNFSQPEIEFLPYLFHLSLGGSPTTDLMNLGELREEVEDISKEISNEGKAAMEAVKEDKPGRGRIAVYVSPLYREVKIGYLEFEVTELEGENRERFWIVSGGLGTGHQEKVREKELALIPKGVKLQSYILSGLLGSLSIDDLGIRKIEDIGTPEEESSYVSKEVGKIIWELKNRLNLSWAKVVCVAAPFAIEAEDCNGYHFYFRERGGMASLSLVSRPGISFSTAIERSIPLVRVEKEETFVVGGNPGETVEVISDLYQKARNILREMYA